MRGKQVIMKIGVFHHCEREARSNPGSTVPRAAVISLPLPGLILFIWSDDVVNTLPFVCYLEKLLPQP